MNRNGMNLNGVKVTGERLTQNSRPGFSLATAKPSRARSRAWTDYPPTIYTSQNHKNHAEILFFYKIEQKGLFIENFRGNSTSFVTGRRLPLYDIYEVESQISRRENKKGYRDS